MLSYFHNFENSFTLLYCIFQEITVAILGLTLDYIVQTDVATVQSSIKGHEISDVRRRRDFKLYSQTQLSVKPPNLGLGYFEDTALFKKTNVPCYCL